MNASNPDHRSGEVVDIDRFGVSRNPARLFGPESGGLRLRRQDMGVATLVKVEGTLDRYTALSFVEVLSWFEQGESRPVHLDLSAIRMIDVVGLEAVDAATRAPMVDVLIESPALDQLHRLIDGDLRHPSRASVA